MENQVEADSASVVGRTHSPKAAGRILCRMILCAVWAILSRSVTSFRITMFYEPWTYGTHQSRSLTPRRSVPDNPSESVEYISILPLKRCSPRAPVSDCPSDSCSARPSTSSLRYRSFRSVPDCPSDSPFKYHSSRRSVPDCPLESVQTTIRHHQELLTGFREIF